MADRIIGPNSYMTHAEAAGATVVTVSTTTYTFLLTDAFKTIKTTNGSAVTLTIPANADVAFPVGTVIFIEQWGDGQVTIDPDTGVTMNSASGADKINDKYVSVFIRKDATNTWILIGNITT